MHDFVTLILLPAVLIGLLGYLLVDALRKKSLLLRSGRKVSGKTASFWYWLVIAVLVGWILKFAWNLLTGILQLAAS